ncbi:hypothetical protein [Psychrobacillus sp. NPDC093180]|uniref:hypothetical protein n=1 Tax=Psychrobacillus sp. NPDC093180 TaxID=3364489 RepID=UPI0038095CA8
MKKIILLLLTTFLLTACINNEDTLKANVLDFEDSGFKNNKGQIIVLVEEGIMVSGTLRLDEKTKKSSIDNVLIKENTKADKYLNKVYKEGKIETKGSKYYVTLDDTISLEFEKIGKRIIKDLQGVEYFTQENPK